MICRFRLALLAAVLLVSVTTDSYRACGQQPLSINMNDASRWAVVQDEDTTADFGFDYSVFGIPDAPGGDDSLGILLRANSAEPAEAAAISVAPNNLSLSGQYSVRVDMWLNFYADLDKVGTTEFGGLLIGFDSTQSHPINGAGMFGDTDGDTTGDYRLYKDDVEQDLESGQYDIVSNNNTDLDLLAEFEGQEVPERQMDIDFFDPPNEYIFTLDGTLAFAWHTIRADVDSQAGTASFIIDDLLIGTVDNSIGDAVSMSGGAALSLWDIFSSVSPVPEFSFAVFDNLVIDGVTSTPGDFDGDSQLTGTDVDWLAEEIRNNQDGSQFDLDGSGQVDADDHRTWVTDLKETWFGDANLDGEFNSGDLVAVFAAGEYEDASPLNSGWGTGDWDGDGDFTTSDLVAAFADGGYEQGKRPGMNAVPEPSSFGMLVVGLIGIATGSRTRRTRR